MTRRVTLRPIQLQLAVAACLVLLCSSQPDGWPQPGQLLPDAIVATRRAEESCVAGPNDWITGGPELWCGLYTTWPLWNCLLLVVATAAVAFRETGGRSTPAKAWRRTTLTRARCAR